MRKGQTNNQLKMPPQKQSSSTSGSIRSVPRQVQRFEVMELVGSGSFGVVHRGIDSGTNEEVALKFESLGTGMLEGEVAVLKGLQQGSRQGFARLHYIGVVDGFRCMVTELLDGNLEDRLVECGGTFTVKTTVLLAQQVLNAMEYLHSRGFVHRDVKPENIMCGANRRQHHVYLIDFGLAERYYGRRRHAPMKRCAFKGTVRYASVNAMRGITQSRRDDLEAVGYMLIYFLRGALPWSGLQARDSDERFRKVREKKAQMEMRDLCSGFPRPFEQFLVCARRMGFEERPNYTALRNFFTKLREEIALNKNHQIHDHELEWVTERNARNLDPIILGEDVTQPEEEWHLPRGLGRLCGRGTVTCPSAL